VSCPHRHNLGISEKQKVFKEDNFAKRCHHILYFSAKEGKRAKWLEFAAPQGDGISPASPCRVSMPEVLKCK